MKSPWPFLWLALGVPLLAQLSLNGNGTPGSSPTVRNFQDSDFKNTLSSTVSTNVASGGSYTTNTASGRVLQKVTSATTVEALQLQSTITGTLASGVYNITWASQQTNIATVNAFGYVTQQGNGTSTLTATTTTPLYIAPYSFNFQTNGGSASTNFLNWALVSPPSLPAHMNSQVDALISAAGTATPGTIATGSNWCPTSTGGNMSIFSAANDSTQTFTRNTSIWTGGVDLSAISVGEVSQGMYARCLTLITPTDALVANHTAGNWQPGTQYRWVDNSNISYLGTCGSSQNVNGDLSIVHINWSGAIPTTLAIAPILPSNYATYWNDHNPNYFPVICTNQYRQVFVQDSSQGTFTSPSFVGGFFYHNPANEASRNPYTLNVVNGDSSSPIFTIINNQAVLLCCNKAQTYGPSAADNISGITSALATLDAGGTVYTLTTVNLTSPIAFPTY